MKTYCFDIDGTLCTNTDGDYEKAVPFPEMIARANRHYDAGDRVILFTARGTTTGLDWRELTERQMREWGVRYHELLLGKPQADVYVDDKAIHVDDYRKLASTDATLAAPQNTGVLSDPSYLAVTYSATRAPQSDYPGRLAHHLLKHYYKRTGRLLDLGCGRGDQLRAFKAAGCAVAGIDISSAAPELVQAGIEVKVADLEREPLPFPAGSFDLVFSKSVVEHLREPVSLLKKAKQALAPGGIAVIMTPSWVHNAWGPFYVDHTHVTPFTAPSLADALTLAGFTNVEVYHFYQLPFLWQMPFLKPAAWLISRLPLPYRPFERAPWPDGLNKLIRFSNEVMLLAVGRAAMPAESKQGNGR